MRQTILLKAAFDAKGVLFVQNLPFCTGFPFDASILQDASKMADLPASPSADAVTPRLAHA